MNRVVNVRGDFDTPLMIEKYALRSSLLPVVAASNATKNDAGWEWAWGGLDAEVEAYKCHVAVHMDVCCLAR